MRDFFSYLSEGRFEEALRFAARASAAVGAREEYVRGFELETAWRAAHFAANMARRLAQENERLRQLER